MKSWLLGLGALVLAGALGLLLFDGPAADPASPGAEGPAAGAAPEAGAGLPAQGGESGTSREEVRADPGSTSPGAGGTGFGSWSAGGPAASVTARLVGADGKPAAGAELRAARGRPDMELFSAFGSMVRGPEPDAERQPIPADAAGLVRLEAPAGEALGLEFGGTYWRPQQRSLDPLRPGETVDLGEIALVPAARLSGRVTDGAGRPIAGAAARLRAADAGMFWEGHALLQSQQTDAEGRVAFAGLPAGRFRIESEAVGYARGQIEALEIRAVPSDAEFELKLKPGAALRGRAVDADRRAVAEVAIYLMRPESGAFWGDFTPPIPEREPDARSAADGTFTVRGLPEDGSPVMLLGHREGFATGRLAKAAPGAEATLVMPPALSVSGRVLREGDLPVAGAEVQLVRKNQWGWEETRAAGRSGEDGAYALPGVEPGEYTLTAAAQGATSEPLALKIERPLADVLLHVAPRPAFRVRVTDPEGRALAGAAVDLSAASAAPAPPSEEFGDFQVLHEGGAPGWSGSQRTGEDGVAVFHGAPAGELTIGVRCKDWARASASHSHSGGDGETTVVLQKPAALLVRVTDGAGGAVRGVVVRLRDPATGEETEEKRSDALGRALWSDLAAGRMEILHGSDPRGAQFADGGMVFFADATEAEETPPPQAGEAVELVSGACVEKEIVLRDLAILTVRVLRAGLPAADVAVRIERVQEDDGEGVVWAGLHGGGGGGVPTDGRGVALLAPTPAGKYKVHARPGRNAPETGIEVELLPGPQEAVIAINGAEVRGVLRSAAGPVVGARVQLEPWSPAPAEETGRRRVSTVFSIASSDGSFAMEVGDFGAGNTSASTDQDGEFLFRDVPEGQWTVRARAEGFAPWVSLPFSVSGDGAVSLPEQLLLPGGVVHGRDLNWKGGEGANPWELDWNQTIRVEFEGGETVGMGQLDERGEYKVKNLSDGSYVVRRGDWKSEPFHVSAGEQVRVDVPLAQKKEQDGG